MKKRMIVEDVFFDKGKWPDPTPDQLECPEFEAIWQAIKSWDINVPTVYRGYCGATGNHVVAILEALRRSRTACKRCLRKRGER